MRVLNLLFGLREPVDRRTYVFVGLLLATFKYALDYTVVRVASGATWSLLAYLTPSVILRDSVLGTAANSWLPSVMVAYTLPFAWIGLTMSVRRAADAGFSPWTGVWFVVPLANYVMIAVLCLAPSRGTWSPPKTTEQVPVPLTNALMSLLFSVLLSLAMLFVSVRVFKEYGTSLFLGTPLVIGLVAGFLTNRDGLVSTTQTLSTAFLAIMLSAGVMLLFGIEGIVCIAMVLVPALGMAAAGAAVGRAIAAGAASGPGRRRPPTAGTAALILALPFVAGFETIPSTPPAREVVSIVEVDAPPLEVWEHVIRFADLGAPTHWLFETGVAYPIRARLEGQGVGAVRRCEFSTGAFVEPITRWEPGHVLSFDVEAQPPPMQEWSPYAHIHPPHLDGYFRSIRGEFRLVELPNGRTRLEGSTWYELDLAPFGYWSLIADQIVHQIHLRVLRHVKAEAEKPTAGSLSGPAIRAHGTDGGA